jgi:Family of unknown function (DUF6356)
MTFLSRLFLTHPRSVDESYAEHCLFALWFAGQLALAAGAALSHAVLPFTCEHLRAHGLDHRRAALCPDA